MISVVVCSNRVECLPNVFANFERQILKEKELILVWNSSEPADERASLKCPPEMSLGECLNRGAALATYPLIAKMDDDDFYGANYLTEVVEAFASTDADVVGKSSFYIILHKNQELRLYNPGHENTIIPTTNASGHYQSRYFMSGATLALKKNLLERIPFPHVNQGEDSGFQQSCFTSGVKMYSTSKDHYAYVRYNTPAHHHSDVSESVLKRRSKYIAEPPLLLEHFFKK